ncbi:PANK2, partial [Symbiodinium pilosum]
WDHYKRGLLSEIRSWNSSASRGIIDREDPAPMTGASSLGDETCLRVGRGEKLWDARAQTPPNETYDPGRAVKQIFHVECTRDEHGKPIVTVDREQRDASMDDFERKLQDTMATARYRDKLRRTAKNVTAGATLENGAGKAGVNAVALTE